MRTDTVGEDRGAYSRSDGGFASSLPPGTSSYHTAGQKYSRRQARPKNDTKPAQALQHGVPEEGFLTQRAD